MCESDRSAKFTISKFTTMSRVHRSSCFLPVLVLALLSLRVYAATMTVDLGSDGLKVGIVQPTKTPISVVLNEQSGRRTAASVAVVKGERLVGEDAAALAARFPEKVFSGFRDMLGKRFDDGTLKGGHGAAAGAVRDREGFRLEVDGGVRDGRVGGVVCGGGGGESVGVRGWVGQGRGGWGGSE